MNRDVHEKKNAPASMPPTTSMAAPRPSASSASANTDADNIMPLAVAAAIPRHRGSVFLRKRTGSAPRPVARAVKSATQKTCAVLINDREMADWQMGRLADDDQWSG